ncbi:porin [Burkholderia diffusa]|uniref:porin n=1 Tax=Burkholderia diffusa TaxID=488732 RepID=UPI0015822B3C|nr:porin [Burkholderia diffusa]
MSLALADAVTWPIRIGARTSKVCWRYQINKYNDTNFWGWSMRSRRIELIGMLMISGAAAAQSSATLFGVADASVRRIGNGADAAYSIGSGGLAASRLGFRADEDIGGGTKVRAWLEGTVNFNDGTGNPSRYWNRRSTLSVIDRYGELRMGHDLTPSYTSFGEFDTFGVSGLADQGKFYSTAFGSGIEATGLWARADNMIAYYTPPRLGGFYAQAAYALGGGERAKRYAGGRVGYANDAVNVTAAFGVFDGLQGPLKRIGFAVSYDLKYLTLLGSAVRNQYLEASRLIAQAGVIVPVNPFLSFRANFTRVSESGALGKTSIDANHATQVAVGYTYALSKRTSTYGTVVRLSNKGGDAFGFGTQPVGRLLVGAELGVSHRF